MHSTDDQVTSGVSRGLPARLEQRITDHRRVCELNRVVCTCKDIALLREAAETITRLETDVSACSFCGGDLLNGAVVSDDMRAGICVPCVEKQAKFHGLTRELAAWRARAEAAEARVAQLEKEAAAIYKGFEHESLNGVVCSIPDSGVETRPMRTWCARCQHRYQRLKELGGLRTPAETIVRISTERDLATAAVASTVPDVMLLIEEAAIEIFDEIADSTLNHTERKAWLRMRLESLLESGLRPPPLGRTGMSEWQPIESAPKDGTEVLVWDGHNCMVSAFLVLDELGCGEWNTRALCAEEPTHWMPLPTPPKPVAGAEGAGQ